MSKEENVKVAVRVRPFISVSFILFLLLKIIVVLYNALFSQDMI